MILEKGNAYVGAACAACDEFVPLVPVSPDTSGPAVIAAMTRAHPTFPGTCARCRHTSQYPSDSWVAKRPV
jgi:hypothetical protein